jgi:hypothetical protein
MKYSVTLLCALLACLLFSGCETVQTKRLEKFTMHGNDSFIPAEPLKSSHIQEASARKPFRKVPQEILNQYYDKVPDATRLYNMSVQNMKFSKKTQDQITREFIFSIVDYELKKIRYKASRSLVELGLRRSDLPLPEIKFVDKNRLFQANQISQEQKRKFNNMRTKYEYLKKIDSLVAALFVKCGLKEADRFWFKKFTMLRYEFVGFTWTMYQANNKLRELL